MKTENAAQQQNRLGMCVALIVACLASLSTRYHLLRSGIGLTIYTIALVTGGVFILRGLFYWRNSHTDTPNKT